MKKIETPIINAYVERIKRLAHLLALRESLGMTRICDPDLPTLLRQIEVADEDQLQNAVTSSSEAFALFRIDAVWNVTTLDEFNNLCDIAEIMKQLDTHYRFFSDAGVSCDKIGYHIARVHYLISKRVRPFVNQITERLQSCD